MTSFRYVNRLAGATEVEEPLHTCDGDFSLFGTRFITFRTSHIPAIGYARARQNHQEPDDCLHAGFLDRLIWLRLAGPRFQRVQSARICALIDRVSTQRQDSWICSK